MKTHIRPKCEHARQIIHVKSAWVVVFCEHGERKPRSTECGGCNSCQHDKHTYAF